MDTPTDKTSYSDARTYLQKKNKKKIKRESGGADRNAKKTNLGCTEERKIKERRRW